MNETCCMKGKSSNVIVLTNESMKNVCLNHLDKKHIKTMHTINQMREEQLKNEQMKCFPTPMILTQSKNIIKHIQDNKAFYYNNTITNDNSCAITLDHSKIRMNSMKRVIKMFIKEDYLQLAEKKNKENIEEDKGLMNKNVHLTSLAQSNIVNQKRYRNNDINNNMIRKIIETRLKLNSAMGIKASPMYTYLNDNKPKVLNINNSKHIIKTAKTPIALINTLKNKINPAQNLSKSHSQLSIHQDKKSCKDNYIPETQPPIIIIQSNYCSFANSKDNITKKEHRLEDLTKFFQYFKINQ